MFGRNKLFVPNFVADFSFFAWFTSGAKQFHNLNVSSAAALITVLPSGDIAICSTRAVCPVNSHCFCMDGYFQIVNWLLAYPWAEMISLYLSESNWIEWWKGSDQLKNDIYKNKIRINLECEKVWKQKMNKSTHVFDHSNEQTCDLESIESMSVPLLTFQNFIQRSAVPPPVAKTFGCHGHHARARTAAWCWLNMWSGSVTPFGVSTLALVPPIDGQIFTKLSFPPLAKYLKSVDHFRPHTSCVCPVNVVTLWSLWRTSWCIIDPSRLPELMINEFQASDPTRAEWPSITRNLIEIVQKCRKISINLFYLNVQSN